ncbi:MAG: LysE family translocator [Sedimenticola sp.]|nr:LysE family translocator [Sedimenticola sp.]
MFSSEFFVTSLIIVMLPGTGVIYTVSVGLLSSRRASLAAVLGCTLGILPHLLLSILGLSAVLHMSEQAFLLLKYLGAAYLLYVAWSMWRESGKLSLQAPGAGRGLGSVALKGFLINILNPKLSMFLVAFLPQFVPVASPSPSFHLLMLSGVFMLITLVVFTIYGLFAGAVRHYVLNSPRVLARLQRGFALSFAALGARLVLAER